MPIGRHAWQRCGSNVRALLLEWDINGGIKVFLGISPYGFCFLDYLSLALYHKWTREGGWFGKRVLLPYIGSRKLNLNLVCSMYLWLLEHDKTRNAKVSTYSYILNNHIGLSCFLFKKAVTDPQRKLELKHMLGYVYVLNVTSTSNYSDCWWILTFIFCVISSRNEAGSILSFPSTSKAATDCLSGNGIQFVPFTSPDLITQDISAIIITPKRKRPYLVLRNVDVTKSNDLTSKARK
ncbi:hypothetical protein Trydic_g9173 [Trypoxylus dichotomus]